MTDRFYTRGEQKLVSVTTVNSVIAKPDLYKWNGTSAARRAVDHLAELQEKLSAEGKGATVDWLTGAGDDIRDSAAARGTRVHHAIERYLSGAPALAGLQDEREHAIFRGFRRFQDDYELEVLDQELAVCRPEHGWAGRYDWRGKLFGSFGEPVVGDWKTGATGPHSSWALQLAAYASGTELVDGGDAPPVSQQRAVAVRLYPDAYSVHWIDGEGGRPSIRELYLVFRAAKVVRDFEASGELWK